MYFESADSGGIVYYMSYQIFMKHACQASLQLWQEVIRQDQQLYRRYLSIVCLDADTLRPRKIPDAVLAEL